MIYFDFENTYLTCLFDLLFHTMNFASFYFVYDGKFTSVTVTSITNLTGVFTFVIPLVNTDYQSLFIVKVNPPKFFITNKYDSV